MRSDGFNPRIRRGLQTVRQIWKRLFIIRANSTAPIRLNILGVHGAKCGQLAPLLDVGADSHGIGTTSWLLRPCALC